jgi:hypothetical protein
MINFIIYANYMYFSEYNRNAGQKNSNSSSKPDEAPAIIRSSSIHNKKQRLQGH